MVSLHYLNQVTQYLIGSEDTPSPLTTSYGDNQGVIAVGAMVQVELYITYVPGENDAELYIQTEMGPTSEDFYKAVQSQTANGVNTVYQKIEKITGAVQGTTYKYRLSEPVADNYLRISAKETATSPGTLTIQATYSGL